MIYIAYDHGGFDLAQKIKKYLSEIGEDFESVGSDIYDPKDDYTISAFIANKKIVKSPRNKGIYICTTGIGSSIVANRESQIRAAVCDNVHSVTIARQKNNLNVLVLGSEQINFKKAKKIINVFLNTPFEGGRHLRRVRDLTYGIKDVDSLRALE